MSRIGDVSIKYSTSNALVALCKSKGCDLYNIEFSVPYRFIGVGTVNGWRGSGVATVDQCINDMGRISAGVVREMTQTHAGCSVRY